MRTVDTDVVEDNIDQECRKNGERQRREMWRALRSSSQSQSSDGRGVENGQGIFGDRPGGDGNKDIQMDEAFYGQTGSVPMRKQKYHTEESLVAAMAETIRYLEVDCQVVKRDADELLDRMQQIVREMHVDGGSVQRSSLSPSSSSATARHANLSAAETMEAVKNLKTLEDAIDKCGAME